MPSLKKATHGGIIKARAIRLFEAILDVANKLEIYENLGLRCDWKDTPNPKLTIKTTLRALEELIVRDRHAGKLTKQQIREALKQMENFLKILDDHRLPPKRGNEEWHFTLMLWSKDKEVNLEQFEDEWEQRRSSKSKQLEVDPKWSSTENLVQSDRYSDSTKEQQWSGDLLRALQQAIRTLIDIGQTDEARTVARLLLERNDLQTPLQKDLERFLETPIATWRLEIDRYILRQQPFQLSYQDAEERVRNFTVYHAKVALHEKRQYLDCRCAETEGNQDIDDLRYNWCLRLDRIQDAAVTPIEGQWLPSLDQIEVEMNLLRGLAFAYRAKPEDSENDWLADQSRIRRVVRKVSSTFWFLREVMQYGEDCVIVSPESVQKLLIKKLIAMCQQYKLDIRK
jgi:hypothetical protein